MMRKEVVKDLDDVCTRLDRHLDECERLARDLRESCNGLTSERNRKSRRIGELQWTCGPLIMRHLADVGPMDPSYERTRTVMARYSYLCGYADADDIRRISERMAAVRPVIDAFPMSP